MKRNTAVIGLGSNIEPELNIELARRELAHAVNVLKASSFVETEPVGYKNQNAFLNGALLVETPLEAEELKDLLRRLEKKLGRVRNENKFGPRTIDLDILVWNGEVYDNDVYMREFLRYSILELIPDLNLGKSE